jgi:hypothetical protein
MIGAIVFILFLALYISSVLKFKYVEDKPLDFCLVFSIIIPVYMLFIMLDLLKYLYRNNKSKNIFKMIRVIVLDLPFIHSLAIFVLARSEKDLTDELEKEFTDRVFTRVYKD